MPVTLGKSSVSRDMRVYAIGDVHGCLEEMKRLFGVIELDLETNPVKDHRIIFLGDYLDRGPDSKGVVDQLIDWKKSNPRITFLLGNHDEKLLRACGVLSPGSMGSFLKYGGKETLKSYGFDDLELHLLGTSDFEPHMALAFAKTLVKRLPEEHLKFLKNLEKHSIEGDYFFCHAGVRPGVGFQKQKDDDLIWIREPFLSWDKPMKYVVVHGHTRQDEVDERINRINVDTSCCYGNALSAVVLEHENRRYLKAKADRAYWTK